MATAYTPWGPNSGPGNYYGTMPPFAQFAELGLIVNQGYAYTSGLGPNTTPNPGPIIPDINGILLEETFTGFVALETGLGGPNSVLLKEV